MTSKIVLLIALAVVAGGCTTGLPRSDTGPTPIQVAAGGQASGAVHWGGQIVQVRNLRDRTQIEVLALPLQDNGRPRIDAKAEGRFIAERSGFLEPREYAVNRLIEVRGQLNGFTSGQVGQAAYRYPLVLAEQLVLWPGDSPAASGSVAPRINFGVGVGSHGSGVGVGIGF